MAFYLTFSLAICFLYQVKPDVISFTSVIHACAGPHGNWEKAYEVRARRFFLCIQIPRAPSKQLH